MGRGALLLVFAVSPAFAESLEIELGAENLYYRTAETPLNRGNLLGLAAAEDQLRASLSAAQRFGEARMLFRGYAEQAFGRTDTARWRTRQAYLQYAFGSGLQLRLGKQRIAWGSGFAWNPTNRLEPPKNPLNTGLEQEGAWAARMDVIPSAWAGVVLVAARGSTNLGDLPFATARAERTTGAIRARFLLRDTDLAVVYLGGKNQKTLVGLDAARDVFGRVSLHAEAAFHRGSEIDPLRQDETFFRVAAGALHTEGSTSLSLEYFFNGEGLRDTAHDRYLDALEASYARSHDPSLSPAARTEALGRHLGLAAVPFAGGMGLRRHYLQAACSRSEIGGEWTLALRASLGISDGGIALTPGVAWAPRPDTTLGVDGVILVGQRESEYRLAPVKGAVQARVKVAF